MSNENIVKTWRKKCVDHGTSLNAICKKVGVDRVLLTRWEKAEPKSLRLAKQIADAIDKLG